MNLPPAIELRRVTKDFSIGLRGVRLRALDDVTLRVAPGEVFGLLGPNGSGKSTTIKILLGLVTPTAGACEIHGIPSDRVEARRGVGYLPEGPDFHRFLSGHELVTWHGRLAGLGGARLRERVAAAIDAAGLPREAANRRVATYSQGMLRRVGLAQALVHDPRVVVLDEPTAGLDPFGADAMGGLVRRLKAEGRTVLLTSHLLAHVEEQCDRIGILHRGRLIFEAAVNELPGGARLDLIFRERVLATEANA
ncbi:MAG TPA: ABC transporter ATP-binding protein [Opitutus sp.]|nr:ABC transporter ATP-binding protein [Opitutus sp.]